MLVFLKIDYEPYLFIDLKQLKFLNLKRKFIQVIILLNFSRVITDDILGLLTSGFAFLLPWAIRYLPWNFQPEKNAHSGPSFREYIGRYLMDHIWWHPCSPNTSIFLAVNLSYPSTGCCIWRNVAAFQPEKNAHWISHVREYASNLSLIISNGICSNE